MTKVYMYTLSNCPWCKKTKQFFGDKKVLFEFIDYDLADEDTQDRIFAEMKRHNAQGFPFVKIDDEIVIGYNPDRYMELLGMARER